MAARKGFWSYVHADDETELGRIQRLAKDVAAQFEMLTGEPLDLFLDRDHLKWGDDWRDTIDENLSSTAFFIPVITPRYFMSRECRRELQFFARLAADLGIRDLILPIYYINVPEIEDETITDDMVILVKGFQREDWRDLRYESVDSSTYRRAVGRLAERLVEVNEQVDQVDIAGRVMALLGTEEGDGDHVPGFLERMAAMEESIPKITQDLHSITEHMQLVSRIMEEGAEEVRRGDALGKGFAARLVVARKVAGKLEPPVQQISKHSNQFLSGMHDVDAGLRLLIEWAPSELVADPSSKEELHSFFESVRKFCAAARYAFMSVEHMAESAASTERLSRDLRPVIRTLRHSLMVILEARELVDDWDHLIENIDMD